MFIILSPAIQANSFFLSCKTHISWKNGQNISDISVGSINCIDIKLCMFSFLLYPIYTSIHSLARSLTRRHSYMVPFVFILFVHRLHHFSHVCLMPLGILYALCSKPCSTELRIRSLVSVLSLCFSGFCIVSEEVKGLPMIWYTTRAKF